MAKFISSPIITPKNLFWFPLFLILYSFTGNLSNDIYMPSMPTLVHIFGTTASSVQLTLSLWFLGNAMPQLFFGPVADRYGRRRLLFLGGVIFLLSTLACGFSTHILSLIIARFFQGVGVASLTVVGFAVIRELYQDKRCVRLLSSLNLCNAIAPLLGPILGGYIFILLGWRANFHVVFFLALIGLIGLWYLMPESQTTLDKTALKPKVIVSNYLGLIKNKLFMRNLLAFGLFFGGMIVYLTGAPFILIERLALAPQNFGFTQLAVFSCFLLGSFLVGRLSDRLGARKVIGLGMVIIAIGSLSMLILSVLLPLTLYSFVGSMMIYALGFGLASGPLAKETLSATKVAGGFSAAMLGFSMTGFGSMGSFIVSFSVTTQVVKLANYPDRHSGITNSCATA